MKNFLLPFAAGLVALWATQGVWADDAGTRPPSSLIRPAEQLPIPGGTTSLRAPTAGTQGPATAQAGPPSWQTAPAARQPNAANGPVGNEHALASSPPSDRDCKSVVTRPIQGYANHEAGGFSTDGTEDHGRILNEVANTGRVVQTDLEDLQVRIEQLRCEDQNVKAKLDFLIRMRAP